MTSSFPARRRPLIAVLVALAPVVFATACSRDRDTAATATPTAPATAAPACPVASEICQFAREAETRLRDHDVAWLLAGAGVSAHTSDLMMNLLLVTGEPIRLGTIGCPVVDGGPSCDARFALVMVALPPGDYRDPRGLEVLVFRPVAGSRPLYELTLDAQGPDRLPAAEGGDGRVCDFAGFGNPPGTECIEMHFYPYAGAPPSIQSTPPPSAIGGLPVHPLVAVAPVPVPDDLLVYYRLGCYACDSGLPGFYRAYRNADGALVKEDLLALATGLPTTSVGLVMDVAKGEFYAATCAGDPNCLAKGVGAPPEAPQSLFRSVDGGVSFVPWGQIPARGTLVAIVPAGVLYSVWLGNDGSGPAYRYFVHPSGSEVILPASPDRLYPSMVPGIGLTWLTQRGLVYAADASPLYTRRFPDAVNPDRIVAADGSQRYIQWADQLVKGGPPLNYFAVADAQGSFQAVYSWDREALWTTQPIGGSKLLVGALMANGGQPGDRMFAFEAAILDFAKGTIAPMTELSEGLTGNTNPFPRAALVGRFLRITGAGDCLNVRESASTAAASLGCFKDNVLLADRGQMEQAGGITWAAVRTPSGEEGWASREFLR